MTAGYLLMLVSMACVPLFFCVVLGHVGARRFPSTAPTVEAKSPQVTACCAEARDDADDAAESSRNDSLEREILRDSGTSGNCLTESGRTACRPPSAENFNSTNNHE